MELTALIFLIIFGLLFLVVIAFAIFTTIFWIKMLIDATHRKFAKDDERLLWILIIIFLGVIGALVYYIVIKKAK